MTQLTIGGVPEHFNWPWQVLVESRDLDRAGIDLDWRSYPGGSGAMSAALTSGELDAALLLTEGAVAGIAQGGRFSIASLYVESPLIWGIHVPARSSFASIADVDSATYAISRLGSGSHLMCYVHAKSRGWQVEALKFATVGSLDGAIEAFERGTAEVFFWEKHMTQPVVDAGRFRRIGEFVAPWPAFVLCVAERLDAAARANLAAALDAALTRAQRIARDASSAENIAAHYGLRHDVVTAWLAATRWAVGAGVTPDAIAPAADALRELDLIPRDFDTTRLIAPLA